MTISFKVLNPPVETVVDRAQIPRAMTYFKERGFNKFRVKHIQNDSYRFRAYDSLYKKMEIPPLESKLSNSWKEFGQKVKPLSEASATWERMHIPFIMLNLERFDFKYFLITKIDDDNFTIDGIPDDIVDEMPPIKKAEEP